MTEEGSMPNVRIDDELIEEAEQIMEEQEGRWASRSALVRFALGEGLRAVRGRPTLPGSHTGDEDQVCEGMLVPLYAVDSTAYDPVLSLGGDPSVPVLREVPSTDALAVDPSIAVLLSDDMTAEEKQAALDEERARLLEEASAEAARVVKPVGLVTRPYPVSLYRVLGLWVEHWNNDAEPVVMIRDLCLGGGANLLHSKRGVWIEQYADWPGHYGSNPGLRDKPIVRNPNRLQAELIVRRTETTTRPWIGRIFVVVDPLPRIVAPGTRPKRTSGDPNGRPGLYGNPYLSKDPVR